MNAGQNCTRDFSATSFFCDVMSKVLSEIHMSQLVLIHQTHFHVVLWYHCDTEQFQLSTVVSQSLSLRGQSPGLELPGGISTYPPPKFMSTDAHF